MAIETPRTDECETAIHDLPGDVQFVVSADFARTLERENAMLRQKVEAAVSQETINRLECNRLRAVIREMEKAALSV